MIISKNLKTDKKNFKKGFFLKKTNIGIFFRDFLQKSEKEKKFQKQEQTIFHCSFASKDLQMQWHAFRCTICIISIFLLKKNFEK